MKSFLENNNNSKLREQTVEYKFLFELLEYSASIGKSVEIARVEHDTFGYDVILKVDDVVRFVQLKSKIKSGKTPSWDIHKSLIENVNGTVILLMIKYSESTISLDYRILDQAKRNKIILQDPKKDNSDKCRIKIGDFSPVVPIAVLFKKLFELKYEN